MELAIGAYLLLPIRLLCIALGVIGCYVFARIGLSGRRGNSGNPIGGWRRVIAVNGISFLTWVTMFICGFYRLKVKGANPAPAYEAPVYIAAPKTSFLDELVPLLIRVSPVIPQKRKERPILGVILRAVMSLSHSGDVCDSDVLDEVATRAATAGWLPIMIFPEEVHTNGLSLTYFPIDLFQVLKPVQPVLVSFSHSACKDPLQQSPTLCNVLSFLCTFKHSLSIEYLEVMYPDQENEREFSTRVKEQLANALSINTSEHSREDLDLMKHAGELGLPPQSGAVEFMSLKKVHDNLTLATAKKELNRFSQIDRRSKGVITQADLADYLKESTTNLACFFRKYKLDSNGDLTFQSFLEGHLQQFNSATQSPAPVEEERAGLVRSRSSNVLLQRHSTSSCEPEFFKYY